MLLVLLAAFAFDPPEHRCRTQSTRNRQARNVRMDDHDGDHNRWHERGFNDPGRNTDNDDHGIALPIHPPGFTAPVLTSAGPLSVLPISRASRAVLKRVRGRAPPTSSLFHI